MTWIVIGAVLLLLLVVFIAAALKHRQTAGKADDEPWPFVAKRPVLSDPEQVLFHRLAAALPECIVLAQVQLSRVLAVKKGYKFHTWNNRISQKSLDFVVCLKDFTTVAVIELDDSTHSRNSRQVADATKDRALADADVKLFRWTVTALPDEATIRAMFTT